MTNERSPRGKHSDFVIPQSLVIRESSFFQFCLCDFFSHKFLLRPAASSFSSLKVFTIVLGGTAALHAHRAWGAVLFWAKSNDEVNDHVVDVRMSSADSSFVIRH